MNANTRQGYQGYRASPATAGRGAGRERAFSVMYKERAKFAQGVYNPYNRPTGYAIGLTDSYNPVYGAIRQGSGRITHIHESGRKAVMYKKQATGFNRFIWICSCGCGYRKEIES